MGKYDLEKVGDRPPRLEDYIIETEQQETQVGNAERFYPEGQFQMHPWREVAAHAIVGAAMGFLTPIGETGAEIVGSAPITRNLPILHGTRPEARLAVFIPIPWVNSHTVEALLKTVENISHQDLQMPQWFTVAMAFLLGGKKFSRQNKALSDKSFDI
jgi:hypothetical protein